MLQQKELKKLKKNLAQHQKVLVSDLKIIPHSFHQSYWRKYIYFEKLGIDFITLYKPRIEIINYEIEDFFFNLEQIKKFQNTISISAVARNIYKSFICAYEFIIDS